MKGFFDDSCTQNTKKGVAIQHFFRERPQNGVAMQQFNESGAHRQKGPYDK